MATFNCNHEIINDFLNCDPQAAELNSLISHLDVCTDCQSYYLAKVAAEKSWQETEELLKPSEYDAASRAECASGSATSPQSDFQQVDEVLSRLAPSDDPHSLGRIGGHEVTGVVGAGAMGVVLKVFDSALDRVVAIKVLSPHLASSGTARRRFEREAKAVAAILHPNVIPIHSVSGGSDLDGGGDKSSKNGLPFFVMSYVRGTSLQKRLDDHGPLQVEEVLRIAYQVASGLSASHAQGLVHRDIKPANILLEGDTERVTITDFGLARAVDDVTLTRAGVITGTPQYMSPEQSNAESVDPRSDLFSLGSMMYALCTGRPPFRSQSSYGLVREINECRPIAIQEVNSQVPLWLCKFISQLMAKDKQDRFDDAERVCELMEACLKHLEQPSQVLLPNELVDSDSNNDSKRFLTPIGVITMTFLVCVAFGVVTYSWPGNHDTPSFSSGFQGDPKDGGSSQLGESDTQEDKDLQERVQSVLKGQSPGVTVFPKGTTRLLYNEELVRYVRFQGDRVHVHDLPTDNRKSNTIALVGLKGSLVTRVALNPDGKFLACSTNDQTTLWNLDTGGKTAKLFSDDPASQIHFSHSGRIMFLANQKKAVLYNGRSGEVIVAMQGHEGQITHVQFDKNEKRVLTGSDNGLIVLWDAVSGKKLESFEHAGILTDVRFSPSQDTILTASSAKPMKGHSVRVWDIETGKLKFDLPHSFPVTASFRSDGQQVVSVTRNKLTWWNSKTGEKLDSLVVNGIECKDARFSPDQKHLVVYRGRQALLWNLDQRLPVNKFKSAGNSVYDQFSADQRQGYQAFYSLNAKGAFKFWAVESADEIVLQQ